MDNKEKLNKPENNEEFIIPEFEDYQMAAGDILSDNIIKVNDVARLYRYIKRCAR